MPGAESALHPSIHRLYSDHHGWLQGWLQRKLGNAFDAADLAQDTFVRMLTAPDDLPEKQAGWNLREPRAYLTVIARRLMANLHRRRSLEQAYAEALALLPEPHMPSAEQQAIILETLQEIDAMLDILPAAVRRAFLLAQLDGLTYAEIAQQMALSERTVKRYMAQAMARCILLTP